jgi:hypothetical protein
VVHVSVKGCSVVRGVGEVRGTKERGRKWRRRRREGRVGGDYVREASVKPRIFIENPNPCTIAIVPGSVAIA